MRNVKAVTKLAPLKTLSIPKLELNAAVSGARLARFVETAITRSITSRYFWTDSSTVRNWVRATAALYQPFVSHRIGEIQTITTAQEWRFVPGRLNPADIATRSTIESEAMPSTWLDGPPFLCASPEDWPADMPWIAVGEEARAVRAYPTVTAEIFDWGGVELSQDDLPSLLKPDGRGMELIRRCQAEVYPEELERLRRGQFLRSGSSLLPLSPILGADGLLRLGGRTGRAPLPYDNLHPPVLPGRHATFTRAPFTYTACDYFGPLETSTSRNRTVKRWGALFTCMVTRAVYLDLATSLSTDDFLLVLRRFIGVYGRPKQMFSGNGTNFVGDERELRQSVEELQASVKLQNFLDVQAIKWHFQPARTPHFGAAHEALVRCTKRALYSALDAEKKGLRWPTEDTLRTLLFEVAGLLNERPLTYASSDPRDLWPLTPNDFLNRPPTADAPLGDFRRSSPQERYRYVKHMTNMFWDLWEGPYLQSLVARKKWRKPVRNLQVGDLVLEINKDQKRGNWRCSRVVETFPGEDGLVRAVAVQFEDHVTTRGVNTL